jgi:hypothetical protein
MDGNILENEYLGTGAFTRTGAPYSQFLARTASKSTGKLNHSLRLAIEGFFAIPTISRHFPIEHRLETPSSNAPTLGEE